MFVALPLLISAQNVYAASFETETPAKEKIKIHKEPLMASHLAEKMMVRFNVPQLLTYTSGHSFYDTPIQLIDEQGKKIPMTAQ